MSDYTYEMEMIERDDGDMASIKISVTDYGVNFCLGRTHDGQTQWVEYACDKYDMAKILHFLNDYAMVRINDNTSID